MTRPERFDRARVVAESRATLARHARTFDLAGWFLPPERLDEAAVVYAFCRLVDGTTNYSAASSTAAGLFAPLRDITDGMDWENQRPYEQWWMGLRPVLEQLSRRPGQE